jgi:hypothetical protein
MATEDEIRGLKQRHGRELLGQPGVSGVGIERDDAGEYVLAVHLGADAAETASKLPQEIEGHRVKYIVSGPFRKFRGDGT